MPRKYLTPKEAASALGLSTTTISRCVKRGAPVHRWGSTGTRYRICLEEFVAGKTAIIPLQENRKPSNRMPRKWRESAGR